MLGRDEFVFHGGAFALRRFEHLRELLRGLRRCAARRFRKAIQLGFDNRVELRAVDADFVQKWPRDAFRLCQERGEQMKRINLRIASIGRDLLRSLDGLLGFDREFVESKCHMRFLPAKLSCR